MNAAPLIIGHRGACGYAAENSLVSAALAHTQGVDLIELDVILSHDNELVACHDLHLNDLTDVAARFPDHNRADGLTYVIDLDWAKLRTLHLNPRHDGSPAPRVFPPQPLATLDQHLDQLVELNRNTNRRVELYLELKSPAWHSAADRDLCAAVLTCLARHNLTRATDPIIVESFDPAALKRLCSKFKTSLRLTQLLGENAWHESTCDYDAMRTDAGLRDIATYAQAIATNLDHATAPFVRAAHAAGLNVHAYTFRADALPTGYATTAAALHALFNEVGIDGLFTDHPDIVAHFLGR